MPDEERMARSLEKGREKGKSDPGSQVALVELRVSNGSRVGTGHGSCCLIGPLLLDFRPVRVVYTVAVTVCTLFAKVQFHSFHWQTMITALAES